MAKLYNLAVMTVSGTPGTGTITLGSAATINGVTFLSFAAAGVANGDIVDYSISDTGASEAGTGIYTSAGTTLTRTVTKSTNANAAINASSSAIVRISPRAETLTQGPTIQRFTSGTAATYTTPVGCAWIRIRMVGGGSGASGSGTGAGNAGTPTASTWSGGTLSAGGAAQGQQLSGGNPGGTASGGNIANVSGEGGSPGTGQSNGGGPAGGNSVLGGAGQGTLGAVAGANASTNSGSGGGSGGVSATVTTGVSGGAGGYVEHIIVAPAATYTYTVGQGSTGGTAGTNGAAGGSGAAGLIIVEEYYLG